MKPRFKFPDRTGRLIQLVVLLATVVLLAGSLDRLELKPGVRSVFTGEDIAAAPPTQEKIQETRDHADPPTWFLWLLLLPVFYLVYRVFRLPRKDSSRPVNWQSLAILFPLAIGLTALVGFWLFSPGRVEIDVTSEGLYRDPSTVLNPAFESGIHSWMAVALVILALFFSLLLILRLYISDSGSAEPARTADSIRQHLTGSAAAIGSGEDTGNTIIQCYANMCQILNEHRGIDRKASVTAQEFMEELEQLGFENRHISELTRLFEKARYSRSRFTMDDSRRAAACMHEITRQASG